LLEATGERRGAFRDHMLFALALGTGLREHELVGLNVGDITNDAGAVRRRFQLRVFKRSTGKHMPQEVILPERLRLKLARYLKWKAGKGESVEPRAPLFLSERRSRLSMRQVRYLFATWQKRAGFERHLHFHALRHTACSNLYRRTKDLRVVQRFGRHKSVHTTSRYSHPSESEHFAALQSLPC
jgi:integrase/recombinase XerC